MYTEEGMLSVMRCITSVNNAAVAPASSCPLAQAPASSRQLLPASYRHSKEHCNISACASESRVFMKCGQGGCVKKKTRQAWIGVDKKIFAKCLRKLANKEYCKAYNVDCDAMCNKCK